MTKRATSGSAPLAWASVAFALGGTVVSNSGAVGGYWSAGLELWVFPAVVGAVAATLGDRWKDSPWVVDVCAVWLAALGLLSVMGVGILYLPAIFLMAFAAVRLHRARRGR